MLDLPGERESLEWRSYPNLPAALAAFGGNMDANEVLETLEMLEGLTPADDDELQAVADALADAMTALEKRTEARTKATADLRKQLDEACEPFKEDLENQAAIIEAAKAAIVRRIQADEKAQDAAIAARSAVPEPRKLPRGVQVKCTRVVVEANAEELDDRFLCVAVDTDAILAADAAGEKDLAGVTIDTKITASLNRKNAGLLP